MPELPRGLSERFRDDLKRRISAEQREYHASHVTIQGRSCVQGSRKWHATLWWQCGPARPLLQQMGPKTRRAVLQRCHPDKTTDPAMRELYELIVEEWKRRKKYQSGKANGKSAD